MEGTKELPHEDFVRALEGDSRALVRVERRAPIRQSSGSRIRRTTMRSPVSWRSCWSALSKPPSGRFVPI